MAVTGRVGQSSRLTRLDALFENPMVPDAPPVLKVACAGERLGCTEALFTLGERPEQRYPEARAWLASRGYTNTTGARMFSRPP